MFILKYTILNLTKSFAAREVYPPYLNINPTLIVPKYIQSDTGDTIIPDDSITGDMPLRIIALELTIDYKTRHFVDINSIYNDFDLKKTELKLKKFVKKTSPTEKYDESKHKPSYIILPDGLKTLSGFKLWISPNVYSERKGRIEGGTQFISLFSPPENEIKTKEELKYKIDQFMWFLEIGDGEPTDYSFCFEIKVFLKKYKGSGLPESFIIHSRYFNFEVTQDGYSLNLNYVSESDYHIV